MRVAQLASRTNRYATGLSASLLWSMEGVKSGGGAILPSPFSGVNEAHVSRHCAIRRLWWREAVVTAGFDRQLVARQS
jgi:hypothetical protein